MTEHRWKELEALREEMAEVGGDANLAYAARLGEILAMPTEMAAEYLEPDFGPRGDEGGEGVSPEDPPDGAGLERQAAPSKKGGAPSVAGAAAGQAPDAEGQGGAESSRVGRPSAADDLEGDGAGSEGEGALRCTKCGSDQTTEDSGAFFRQCADCGHRYTPPARYIVRKQKDPEPTGEPDDTGEAWEVVDTVNDTTHIDWFTEAEAQREADHLNRNPEPFPPAPSNGEQVERRWWTIHVCPNGQHNWHRCDCAGGQGEDIEVMPVSEHQAEVERLREQVSLAEALKDDAYRYQQAAEDLLNPEQCRAGAAEAKLAEKDREIERLHERYQNACCLCCDESKQRAEKAEREIEEARKALHFADHTGGEESIVETARVAGRILQAQKVKLDLRAREGSDDA